MFSYIFIPKCYKTPSEPPRNVSGAILATMKGGIAIFEEFAKEVQATLKDLPKVTSDDYVIDFTDKAMDMLDAIFYNTTPDKIKLTNCIKVAANAYRLYEAHKATA